MNRTGLTDTLGTINKIFFINTSTGWAVTSRGGILKTTDGGENWFEQLYDIVGNFNSIYFVDSLYGWVSNLAEWLYKTTDGGENWIQQTSSNIYSTTDIYLRDSLNGFAVKLLELYKTSNSGNNWVIQVNSQYVIRKFGWLSVSHGFIMGDGVYETIDSGNTWNEIIELRNLGLRKFQAPKSYIGYSSGYLGLIYKYLDTTIVPVELTSFIANVDNDIVTLKWSTATETNNLGFEVLRSRDNQNWNSLVIINGNGTTTLRHDYQYMDIVEIAGCYYYKLKQIDYNGDFNYSNIIEVNVNIPIGFELLQNFPNPFNSSSTIRYQLPKDDFVNLIVYDVLGKEVKTLIEENENAGYYSVLLNADDLSSGIYFYKLTTSTYNSTKKFILLK